MNVLPVARIISLGLRLLYLMSGSRVAAGLAMAPPTITRAAFSPKLDLVYFFRLFRFRAAFEALRFRFSFALSIFT